MALREERVATTLFPFLYIRKVRVTDAKYIQSKPTPFFPPSKPSCFRITEETNPKSLCDTHYLAFSLLFQ